MTFTIIQTKTTPYANFKDGYLLIRGRSVPFEYPEIYDTIYDRLKVYMKKPERETRVDIDLSAINAVSKFSIMQTFRLFEEMNRQGANVQVSWYYQLDDEDVYELGEICKSTFDVDMNIKVSIG
jgi:hypothetical protein